MEQIDIIEAQKNPQLKNDLIEDYIPLMIHTLSKVLGRYISTDETEYSIGLIALDEAINKYKKEQGAFSTYASTVIKNRVIDELRKEKKWEVVSIDAHLETLEAQMPDIELKEEIEAMDLELKKFKINFEDLTKSSPSHYDTRARCFHVSEKTSLDQPIMTQMYRSYKLPIRQIIQKFLETKRFLYQNKDYITCLVLVFYKNFENIKYWVQSTIRDDYHESL